MKEGNQKYCLDTNVLIQAWQKYYSPKLCSDYWEILNNLGEQEKIFVPEEVYTEITKTDDDLSKWLKKSKLPIYNKTEKVIECWKEILNSNPNHQFLVDNTRNRSLADPWVIAHAMNEKSCIVTKEDKTTAANAKPNKIKIPDVCENIGVRWINDFQFVEEMNIRFSCKIL